MTSAERAKEIVQEICRPLDGGRPYLETPHRKLMAEIIAAAIASAEREARCEVLIRVRDAIDRSDSANDYPAWKSEALIVDMINALILIEKD